MTGFMPFDIVPTSTAEVLVTMAAVFLGLCAPPHPGRSCPRLASRASLRTRASLQILRAASPRRYINIIIISSVTTALQQMDSKGAHEKQQLETVPRCSLHSTPLTHPSLHSHELLFTGDALPRDEEGARRPVQPDHRLLRVRRAASEPEHTLPHASTLLIVTRAVAMRLPQIPDHVHGHDDAPLRFQTAA